MRKYKESKVIEAIYCDGCGKTICGSYDGVLVLRGPASWSDRDDEILFEGTTYGDYCKDCSMHLMKAVMKHIPLVERYAYKPENHDEVVKAEVALIKEHEESEDW